MDTRRFGILKGFTRTFNILVQGTSETTDGTVLDGPGYGLNGLKIAGAGNGEN
jgi:hypothetical protein